MDSSTLVSVAQEVVDVFRQDFPPFDDQVCTVKEVDSVTGSFPYFAAKDVTGKDLGAKKIGTDPDVIELDMSEQSYSLKRYSSELPMDESEQQDINQYRSAVELSATIPMEYNRIAREGDLAALLTASGSNGQQAAGSGAWNVSTSTPVLDMLNLQQDYVPNGDSAIIGYTSAKELRVHPDMKERLGSGYAGGNALSFNELQIAVANILGIDPANVHIWKTYKNSAKFGQSMSLARVTGDFFWFGEKAGLLKVCQKGKQDYVTVDKRHMKISTAVHDTCEYQRVEKFSGGEITGL